MPLCLGRSGTSGGPLTSGEDGCRDSEKTRQLGWRWRPGVEASVEKRTDGKGPDTKAEEGEAC